MNDEAWGEFRTYVKEELAELSNRTRALEISKGIGDERDKQLLEKMDGLMTFFQTHDEHEMRKYNEMGNDLSNLKKIAWMVIGVGGLATFIGFDNIRTAFLG